MSLSKIQSLRTVAVLEDCAYQLDILGRSLSVQISRERGAAFSKEKNRLIKMKTDCQFFTQQISNLCLELEEKQTFDSVPQAVEEEEKEKEKRKQREEKEFLKQRQEAVVRQQQEIKDKREQIHKMYLHLNELKDERAKVQKKKKPNLVEMSQQILTETWKRNQLLGQLVVLKNMLEEEKRFHEQSVKFLQNQHEECQQTLLKWKQETKQIQQDKQSKYDNLGCKRTLNIDKLMEMRRMLRKMEQVVLEDKKEQEKLRQQEEEAQAATKLQAWWKGCMVRKGLGPFRKADDSRKGKKKKKKKK
ncbi:dynein regulatory complex protein 9-like [Anableps anableps]